METLAQTSQSENLSDANFTQTVDDIRGIQVGLNAVPLLAPLTGVGHYTYQLIRQFQSILDPQPWLFYGTSWDRTIRQSSPAGVRQFNNFIKKIVPRPHVITRMMRQAQFSKGVREHRVDLYHEPAYMAYRFRGPTVVTVHDISWVRYPETHPADRVREMNRVMPDVVKRAEQIIVDSEFIRREVIDHYGVSESKVTKTLLGVSPEFLPVPTEQCQKILTHFKLQPDRYLLAVGTLEPRKNLRTVIEAYLRLPETVRRFYPLVVVGMKGWGPNDIFDRLHHLIQNGQVRLTGYVPQAYLPALYTGARALLYPSLYEGFGLPPLEAMACGTPVIASNRASLPEVVGNAGVLVEPMDDISIAHNMQRLIEDEEFHSKLRIAGQLQAQKFSWRKCALETIAVYRKAVQ